MNRTARPLNPGHPFRPRGRSCRMQHHDDRTRIPQSQRSTRREDVPVPFSGLCLVQCLSGSAHIMTTMQCLVGVSIGLIVASLYQSIRFLANPRLLAPDLSHDYPILCYTDWLTWCALVAIAIAVPLGGIVQVHYFPLPKAVENEFVAWAVGACSLVGFGGLWCIRRWFAAADRDAVVIQGPFRVRRYSIASVVKVISTHTGTIVVFDDGRRFTLPIFVCNSSLFIDYLTEHAKQNSISSRRVRRT